MAQIIDKQEYRQRIHKVQDYMETHMGDHLSLEELARVAGFSKFHFSRIFTAILKEPLAHYINRIRMERALFLLAHRPDKNMTDIAYELGFTDSAIFSRAFKHFYGMSPRDYRQEYGLQFKEPIVLSSYKEKIALTTREKLQEEITGMVSLERLEAKRVVYVRHIGSYDTLKVAYPSLMQTLFQGIKELQELLKEQWIIAMYHDNPEFTEEEQFRTSLGMTVPNDFEVDPDGPLCQMTLAGGLYAVGHFMITQQQFPYIWNYMYQRWLTESGYMPSDAPPFEVYLNDPTKDERGMIAVAIYLPVESVS